MINRYIDRPARRQAGRKEINMDSEILVTLYDQLYALSDDEGFELNHIGWNSSFDGSAYTTEQMSEWRDETADNVRLFDHGRILEVACGTGMIYFPLSEDADFYYGVDLSAEGIKFIENHLSEKQKAMSRFGVMEAKDVDSIEYDDFDIGFINSATQYMGPAEMFADYVNRLISRVRHGGKVYLGDIKSAALQEMFYRTIELWGGPVDDLGEKIKTREKKDFEFYIPKKFFENLAAANPRIKHIESMMKKGKAETEMNLYRYGVMIFLDEYEAPEYRKLEMSSGDLADLAKLLEENSDADCLEITGFTSRLHGELKERLFGEKCPEEAVFIKDVCGMAEERGYRTVASPAENECCERFSIRAWR